MNGRQRRLATRGLQSQCESPGVELSRCGKFLDLSLSYGVGKSGGLAVMWRNELSIEKFTDFTIEVKFPADSGKQPWWCICIDGTPDSKIRQRQWQILTDRRKFWNGNRVYTGDLNDIISNDEKWGGRIRENWSFRAFKNFIKGNELIDIGYEGLPWTWSMMWDNGEEIKERLDRVLTSAEWFQANSEVKLTHIQNEASDHSMLLLDTYPDKKK